jgi:GT2 family glycosyltransferase
MEGQPFAPARIFRCGSVSYGSNYEEMLDRSKTYIPDHLESTNWAVRTSLLRDVGGFDEKYGGYCEWTDDDALFKMLKKGGRLVYNPNAYLFHILTPRNRRFSLCFVGNLLRFNLRHRTLWNFKLWVYVSLVVSYAVYQYIRH